MIRPAHIARGALLCLVAMAAPATADPGPPGHADRVEYRDPATPPARGPTHAPVTIEIFFVPGSNMPVNGMRQLEQLQEHHPTRIRVIYRILKSGTSLLAPNVALEAHSEGKFFELMAELGRQRVPLKKEELLDLARKAGVDPQRVALATQFDGSPSPSRLLEHYRDVLEANQRRFERLHVAAAPAVLFNARAPKLLLATVAAADLEREYEAAYSRALDKLDRGFGPGALPEAFDDDVRSETPLPAVRSGPPPDDDTERAPANHPLASPPLSLDGLPSFGKPGVTPAVTIVVLCRPSDAGCRNLLRVVEPEVQLYPDDVRLVWAPWFDVGRDDAADLTLLGDAALCAETIGSNQGELTTSPGWMWVHEVYEQASRGHGRKLEPDKLIDAAAAKRGIDVRALSACRARMASTTLSWVAAARRSGVPRSNTAIVIGGRIYDGLVEQAAIQGLVENELAPGVLGSLPRWSRTAQ